MTRGVAAGPYGDPNRFDAGATAGVYEAAGRDASEDITGDEATSSSARARAGHPRGGRSEPSPLSLSLVSGKYERAISIFRAAYTWVSQSRADAPGLGRVWFGQYAPHSSACVPVYVGAGRVPRAFAAGNLRALDRGALLGARARRQLGRALLDPLPRRRRRTSPRSRAASRALPARAGGSSRARDARRGRGRARARGRVGGVRGRRARVVVGVLRAARRARQGRPAHRRRAGARRRARADQALLPRSWLDSTAFWEEASARRAARSRRGGRRQGATAAAALFSVAGAALAGFVVGRRLAVGGGSAPPPLRSRSSRRASRRRAHTARGCLERAGAGEPRRCRRPGRRFLGVHTWRDPRAPAKTARDNGGRAVLVCGWGATRVSVRAPCIGALSRRGVIAGTEEV